MTSKSHVLRLGLLGPVQVNDANGTSVAPRSRKARALLAILAMSFSGSTSRRGAYSLLWSQKAQEQADASLRQATAELQESLRSLGRRDLLQAGSGNITLQLENVFVDALTLAGVAVGDFDHSLIRGRFLDDMFGLDPALDKWILTWQMQLADNLVRAAARQLATASDAARIASLMERAVMMSPGHEAVWRTLMEAQAQQGDQAAVLRTFERCANALMSIGDGRRPSEETCRLFDYLRRPVSPSPTTDNPVAPLAAKPRQGDRTRLAVMPFRALDAAATERLSLGLAEELATALSSFRTLELVASTSFWPPPRSGSEMRAEWEAAALDYVVEGTIQQDGQQLRITPKLVDATKDGSLVWTARFDRTMGNLLSLQDEIAAEMVAQLDPELLLREGQRRLHRPPANPTAYDLFLQAIPSVFRLDKAGYRRASELLQAAVALDPDFGPAHAWLAYWNILLVGQGWASDDQQAIAAAGEAAARAVALDPYDARALTTAGHVKAYLDGRVGEAKIMHAQAMSLNQNLPIVWLFSGWTEIYMGNHDHALSLIRKACTLSPRDPHFFFFEHALMTAHFLKGELDEAEHMAALSLRRNPYHGSTQRVWLAALGHLGRYQEARDFLVRLQSAGRPPSVSSALKRAPLQRHEDRLFYARGLRLAGVPE